MRVPSGEIGWDRVDIVAFLEEEARYLAASGETEARAAAPFVRALAKSIAEGEHVGCGLAGFDSEEV